MLKRRVADIIADCLVKNGIQDVFCLVGGGSMFINDALGHKEGLTVTYLHHEQSCSMAAEGYVRATGNMAAVCVTTGPGGTNAITGVLGAFQDNYPMLIISGQVRKPTGVESTGLSLRFMGEQEHNIVSTVRPLTKYAKYIDDSDRIVLEIEKAIHIALDGRRGPVWLDIPMDVQNAEIDEDCISHYAAPQSRTNWDIDQFLQELHSAKRPVILTGSAIRSTGSVDKFRSLAHKMGIPVLAATYNGDLFVNNDPIFYGGFGIIGGRAGNFIMQNADLIIGLGCRMAFRQIGFNYTQFSPNSRRMVVDADENELLKPTLRIDVPIHADINTVIDDLLDVEDVVFGDECNWLDYCNDLRNKYPIYQEKFNTAKDGQINPYYFGKTLKSHLSDDSIIVLGNSTIAAHILQLGIEKEHQRIINNMNCGSMGYDLPAAIGAAIGTKRPITLITGDGSIMLNIQELMSAKHYALPIKIFIGANGGYRGVVRSQSNMFGGRYTGCTPDTGVEIPDFSKVSQAFEIEYVKLHCHDELDKALDYIYSNNKLMVIEWPQDPDQLIEPRVMNRKNEHGDIVSTDIDDLSPFLSREEYERMQYSNWILERH